MIYLASPYTSSSDAVRYNRFVEVVHVTGKMLKQNLIVFSPVVHCHMIAEMYDLPKDFTFWENYCCQMLRIAEKMIVLKLDGWEQSIGVAAEIDFAHAHSIPVEYIYAQDY